MPGRATRINKRAEKYDKATPLEMSHIVYVTDDIEPHKEFYVDRLGFKLTDAYPERGYFTGGAAAHNHHNLFLLNPGHGKRGFHHLAFEVGTIHELFGGGNHMTREGQDMMIGPGRHPISSCYFWYFKIPAARRSTISTPTWSTTTGNTRRNPRPKILPNGRWPKVWATRCCSRAFRAGRRPQGRMKPALFDYYRASSIEDAVGACAGQRGSKGAGRRAKPGPDAEFPAGRRAAVRRYQRSTRSVRYNRNGRWRPARRCADAAFRA